MMSWEVLAGVGAAWLILGTLLSIGLAQWFHYLKLRSMVDGN